MGGCICGDSGWTDHHQGSLGLTRRPEQLHGEREKLSCVCVCGGRREEKIKDGDFVSNGDYAVSFRLRVLR